MKHPVSVRRTGNYMQRGAARQKAKKEQCRFSCSFRLVPFAMRTENGTVPVGRAGHVIRSSLYARVFSGTVKHMDEKLAKQLALQLALVCVRNTCIEEIHAGVEPSSETGDHSDVNVV